jgi:putative Holliday junction resolvase
LAIDLGEARIGVSHCDPDGILATPLTTIKRAGQDNLTLANQLAALADDDAAIEIVVGLPVHLSGADGAAASGARAFAGQLAAVWSGPVRLFDERLTTVEANRRLRGAGRDERSGRAVIDQAAATVLLQAAIDQERATGQPSGELVQLESPRG